MKFLPYQLELSKAKKIFFEQLNQAQAIEKTKGLDCDELLQEALNIREQKKLKLFLAGLTIKDLKNILTKAKEKTETQGNLKTCLQKEIKQKIDILDNRKSEIEKKINKALSAELVKYKNANITIDENSSEAFLDWIEENELNVIDFFKTFLQKSHKMWKKEAPKNTTIIITEHNHKALISERLANGTRVSPDFSKGFFISLQRIDFSNPASHYYNGPIMDFYKYLGYLSPTNARKERAIHQKKIEEAKQTEIKKLNDKYGTKSEIQINKDIMGFHNNTSNELHIHDKNLKHIVSIKLTGNPQKTTPVDLKAKLPIKIDLDVDYFSNEKNLTPKNSFFGSNLMLKDEKNNVHLYNTYFKKYQFIKSDQQLFIDENYGTGFLGFDQDKVEIFKFNGSNFTVKRADFELLNFEKAHLLTKELFMQFLSDKKSFNALLAEDFPAEEMKKILANTNFDFISLSASDWNMQLSNIGNLQGNENAFKGFIQKRASQETGHLILEQPSNLAELNAMLEKFNQLNRLYKKYLNRDMPPVNIALAGHGNDGKYIKLFDDSVANDPYAKNINYGDSLLGIEDVQEITEINFPVNKLFIIGCSGFKDSTQNGKIESIGEALIPKFKPQETYGLQSDGKIFTKYENNKIEPVIKAGSKEEKRQGKNGI